MQMLLNRLNKLALEQEKLAKTLKTIENQSNKTQKNKQEHDEVFIGFNNFFLGIKTN